LRVPPQGTDGFLARDVILEIGEHEERVVPEQVVDDRTEEIRVTARQRAAGP
jgi:hypothetical protein